MTPKESNAIAENKQYTRAISQSSRKYSRYDRIQTLNSNAKIESWYVRQAFEFAYAKSFGGIGALALTGQVVRKTGEIFCGTSNGKLGEFAFYQYVRDNGVGLPDPDLQTFGRSIWDFHVFYYATRRIGVKTTKRFGQNMLYIRYLKTLGKR